MLECVRNAYIYSCAKCLVFTVELLKFYGPHHKDYADCHGRLGLHYNCVVFNLVEFHIASQLYDLVYANLLIFLRHYSVLCTKMNYVLSLLELYHGDA